MKRMLFQKDAYFNNPNTPLYDAGKIYDIEDRMVEKWMKRGAVIVEEPTKVEEPVVEEVPKQETETKETVEETEETVEDNPKPTVRGHKNKRHK